MSENEVFHEPLRIEIIDGKEVIRINPGLYHMLVCGNIYGIFCRNMKDSAWVPFSFGPALYLEDRKEEYLPDGMVICNPNQMKMDGIYGAPDLVVEVLSPSTSRNDRGKKKDVYEQHGVREYWIVDPNNRAVEQYVLENGQFTLRDIFQQYPDYELERMTEEERAAIPTSFRCTLFDDLEIRLDDVFYRLPPLE